jgi:uncharacterized protein DUF5317
VRLAIPFLIVAFVLGFVLKGSFSNLAQVQLRYWGLATIGLLLQVVPSESWGKWVPVTTLLLSFLVLTAFALANIREAGFILILIGCLANFTVIAANWGMPVGRDALIASDQIGPLRELEVKDATKHHLANDDDKLVFLADVIPIPNPVHTVASIGDVLVYGGAGVLIVVRMRRPAGKHRVGDARHPQTTPAET